ncbi:MAG: CRISPR-associated endonuclease Cas2 [Ignavibacteriales bacterium]|nr:CRISPR-associated endonuclease Cas2 [Ignavibacteriales bacterium]
MIHLIVYDIADDKQRNSISKLLEIYGVRVQRSVFECNLNEVLYKELLDKLQDLSTEDVDMRIYPLCKECFAKVMGIGEVKRFPGLRGYEII